MTDRAQLINAIAGLIESGQPAEYKAALILDLVGQPAAGETRLLAQIAEQAAYPDGWDGRNSHAMPRAVRLLDCWDADYSVFEAELDEAGDFSLQAYDKDGYTHGGFHFNRDKKAFYTVTHGTKSVATAEFDADTVGGVEAAVCAAKAYWRQTGLL